MSIYLENKYSQYNNILAVTFSIMIYFCNLEEEESAAAPAKYKEKSDYEYDVIRYKVIATIRLTLTRLAWITGVVKHT